MKWNELYKVSATGSTQVWTIAGDLEAKEILIKWGSLNGALQTQTHSVSTNQSGRSIKEQVILEMKARITKQKAKGYRTSIEEAKKHINQNELNLSKPMLAQRFDKVSGIDYDRCYRQYKYDGHRMLVTKQNGKLIAYSRNGKIIDTLDHILDGLVLSEGETIDGEVYHHGVPLQTIASWCKRKQPDTSKLKYMVYDMVSSLDYMCRLQMIHRICTSAPNLQVAFTWVSKGKVTEELKNAMDLGFEGLILRSHIGGYDSGKRSKRLIKVKHAFDDEYEVVDVIPSADGWGVLVCRTKEGQTFNVSAPGNIQEKTEILQNKDLYIGKFVTVEYFSLTKELKPFHPVAIRFREDI